MLEESAFFTAHILNQILRDKAKILLDLFDQSITIFQI